MKNKHFLWQLGLALVIVAFYNPLVQRAVKNAAVYQFAAQVKSMPPSTDVFLGNSLMDAGFNEKAFKSVRPDRQPYRLALNSTAPPEHYCLLRAANLKPGANVYYGFFDITLTQDNPITWDDISGNHLLGILAGNTEAAMSVYAPNDWWKAQQIRVAMKMPVFLNRLQIWSKTELLRRKVGGIGLPKVEKTEYGDVKDFTDSPERDQELRAECVKLTASKAPFSVPVQKMIEYAKSAKINLVIVKMPASEAHRKNFYLTKEWLAYEKHITAMLKAEGIQYVDASTWNPDNEFADGFHLNRATGGARFTRRILSVMEPAEPK